MRRAAGGLRHRGAPTTAAFGNAAVAVLSRAGGSGIFQSDDAIIAADARVDAVIAGRALRASPGMPGSELLDRLIRDHGVASLDGLAADFAFARSDARRRTLLLARDAFGLRPLYWARRAGRVGFASEPEALVSLGVADGGIDREAIRDALFEDAEYDARTPWAGISRVSPGRWVEFDATGRARGGRWFRPERVSVRERWTLQEAAVETREAITAAVRDRAVGSRVGLMLSGGRDSTAVAVALAEAGVRATCFSYVLDAPGVPPEAPIAEAVASELGHEWRELRIAPRLDLSRMRELDRLSGSPLGGVGAPIQLAMYDALRGSDVDVLMSGEGGDLLYMAVPVAIVDVLRRGRIGTAISAARGFHHHWRYPYAVTAKVCLRAITPRAVLALRERTRARPPWLIPPRQPRVRVDRSDRGYLRGLMIGQATDVAETFERTVAHAGVDLTWPLCDLRVVRAGLRLPAGLRIPFPVPKPVLQEALIGREFAARLVKWPIAGFVRDLARNSVDGFRPWLREGTLASASGLVREPSLADLEDERWNWNTVDLVRLEGWLRDLEERDE